MKNIKQITIALFLLFVLTPAYSYWLPLPESSGESFGRGLRNGSEFSRNIAEIQQIQIQNQILEQQLILQKQQIQNQIKKELPRELKDDVLFEKIKSAQLGDPDSAFRVGNIFNDRIKHGDTSYKGNLISALAWYQVSWMMGKKSVILKNGDILAIKSYLEDCRKLKYLNKNELKRADEMALRICSNIPGCAKDQKVQL